MTMLQMCQASVYHGLQETIKEKWKFATLVPCAGHALNLVGVHAATCVSESTKFL